LVVWYIVSVVLQSERMEAMHMEKREEAAFLTYFGILLLLVINNVLIKADIVNIGYLVVVLSCVLKFILIANKNKK